MSGDNSTAGASKARTKKALIFVAFTLLASVSFGQNIEIKGIYLGMARDEFDRLYPDGLRGFTIAGVKSKYAPLPPKPEFKDGVLDSFFFFFDSENFAAIRDAVQSKYPHLKCATTPVRPRAGVEHEQEVCRLPGLSVSKYVSSIDTGGLSMQSQRALEEGDKRRIERNKDI